MIMTKKTNLLFIGIISFFILFPNLIAQPINEDLTGLKHFKINVKTSDDSLFYKLQVEMEVNPILESYTLIVNIKSDDSEKHKIILGGDNEANAIVMKWTDISKELRDGLIAWSKPNKSPVDK